MNDKLFNHYTDDDSEVVQALKEHIAHERVLDRIDVWHTSIKDDGPTLIAFLGWTSDEYREYVENHTLPKREIK